MAMFSLNKKEEGRIAILISGRGTNMENIIRACKNEEIPAKVVLVISDNEEAKGIKIAQSYGVDTKVISRKNYSSKDEFEDEMIKNIKEARADLICLAGFMRVLSERFVKEFEGMIMNIHPALLPSFPGLHAQRQALEYGVKITGATVHFVDEKVDHGPIIIQVAVPVLENDTEESLSERILSEEHKIYIKAIQLFFGGKLKVEGRKVKILV